MHRVGAKHVLSNHASTQICPEEFCNMPSLHLHGKLCIKLVASFHDSPVVSCGYMEQQSAPQVRFQSHAGNTADSNSPWGKS